MACTVCGGDLPAQRGPRPRRYCSRACQAKAYRRRQAQRDAHRIPPGDEQRLVAEYADVPSRELADSLALAARRAASTLTAGLPADDFDLGVLARIPIVLAARANRVAPAAHAAYGITPREGAPTVTVLDLTAPAERAATPEPQTTRDERAPEPKGIEPRPQKLPKKKAAAIVEAAELARDAEDRIRWVLRSGETILGAVEPSYGGVSRSGRNGWISRLAGAAGERRPTRQSAAADLADRWYRLVTAAPRRTLTG